MKVFIVFLSLLIVEVSLMTFHSGLGRYIELQNTFKMASEECAAQAALLLNEEEFKSGEIVFDYEKGQSDTTAYLAHCCRQLGIPDGYTLNLLYEDDFCQYSDKNTEHRPRVTATISVDVSRLFVSPPFENTVITRSSCYELKSSDDFEIVDN